MCCTTSPCPGASKGCPTITHEKGKSRYTENRCICSSLCGFKAAGGGTYGDGVGLALDDVLQEGQSRGFSGNFRYAVSTEGETTRILFLDCGRKLDAFRSFLFASIAISLLGYVVVLLLIAFFSNRIVRPIAESDEKQKRFITDAGHELKTPLTIISADVDVLAMDLGENEWLEDIQKQARRLTALTEELVYLSRMEESEVSLTMIEFSFFAFSY